MLFLLPLFAISCAPILGQGQSEISDPVGFTLDAVTSLGQTFVARHAGLQAIDVYLRPGESSDGVINLHLRSAPDEPSDLAVANLPISAVNEPGYYRFDLTPQAGSSGDYYYALLELEGEGSVTAPAGPADGYLHGAAHRNGQPIDAQLTFLLGYSPTHAALGLAREALSSLAILGAGLLLFVIPGLGLVATVFRGKDSPGWTSLVALSPGVGLALSPILILWTGIIGLRLGALYAWIPVSLGLALLVRIWRGRAQHLRIRRLTRRWVRSEGFWPNLALIVVVGLIFSVRFYVVRNIDAPMWGDSYQHTVIAQLLMDNGGLFDSWEPYAPYGSLTVHYGFPTEVALFSWISGVDSVEGTLLVGQLLNGLAVFSIYPLAVHLARGNRWAGVGAVVVAGLLSPMPAYYVNWGRYAQLAGQAILPVALWMLVVTLESERLSWRKVWLAGGILAGMTLCYYRMPFYYATFAAAWLAGWGLPKWGFNWARWRQILGRMALILGDALLVFLPWGLHISTGNLANAAAQGVTTQFSVRSVLTDYQAWRDLAFYVPWVLVVASLGAIALSLIQKRWTITAIGLWVLGLASLVATRLIHMPGANFIDNFAVLIALYIPVALLVGWLIGQLGAVAEQWKGTAGSMALAILIITTALWSAWQQRKIAQPESFALVTRPDIRAMDWIREHVPSDARFLVEAFRIYGGQSAVGSDAGWWIPLLTERENTMPPQYALLNEEPLLTDYGQRVVDLVAELELVPPSSPRFADVLCSRGITHVYVGQRQGKVGAGAVQLFSPEQLLESRALAPAYHRDRVYVFALENEQCNPGG